MQNHQNSSVLFDAKSIITGIDEWRVTSYLSLWGVALHMENFTNEITWRCEFTTGVSKLVDMLSDVFVRQINAVLTNYVSAVWHVQCTPLSPFTNMV